ncbi:MAG: hypothetical protein U1E27_12675, partial [Kiritimatiellia bacterium]|nr:hypothetical protein [Kiritimatiellia bacterium]
MNFFRSFVFASALWAFATTGHSQEAEEAPPVEAQVPAPARPPVTPALYNPAWTQARTRVLREREVAEAQKSGPMNTILNKWAHTAESELADAQRVRNVSNIRIARALIGILDDVKSQASSGQSVE